MRPKLGDRRKRHVLVAATLVVAGIAAAAVIYVRAGAAPDTPLELSPETSKRYLRDLETYGGTANVLAVEIETWFEGLWHGRALAGTIAVLAALISFGYLFFTVILPPARDPDEPGPDASGPAP